MSPFPLQVQHFNREWAILPAVKTGVRREIFGQKQFGRPRSLLCKLPVIWLVGTGEYQTGTELRSVFFRLPFRFLWLIFYQNSLADLPNDICTFHKISDTIKSRSTEKQK